MSTAERSARAGSVSWGRGETAERGFVPFLSLLLDRPGVTSICEVGGGEAPALGPEEVARRGIEYTVLDISAEELAKAPPGYNKVVADITGDRLEGIGPFDLVFSKMLAEHVGDPRRFHANVFGLLRPGGLAFHYFPTLYSPPFVANRLLPDRLAVAVLRRLRPQRYEDGIGDKFPAYYRWCRGPSERQQRRFESVGFEIDQYVGLFGTKSYYERIPVLQRLEDAVAAWMVRHPVPAMTSYSYVVLRRPTSDGGSSGVHIDYNALVEEPPAAGGPGSN
jgi:SAM-dependent methyltransferase